MLMRLSAAAFALSVAACSLSGPSSGGSQDDDSSSSSNASSSSTGVGASGSGGDASTSTGGGAGGPVPPSLGVLGNGQHTADSVDITVSATSSDGLRRPTDLEFNPQNPSELWVVNQQDNSVTVLQDPGAALQAQTFSGVASEHFLAQPSGIAFSDNGFFATIHEEDQPTQSTTPWDFMGPTLWKADINQFDASHYSHYDMLHNTPNGMGIAAESGNTYWVFDGEHDALTRYQFRMDHGPGGTDHADGVIERYVEGQVSRVAGVPSHMHYDGASGLLYVSDTGNSRVVVLDTNTGSPGSSIQPNYDGVDQYAVNGATLTTLVEGGAMGPVHPSGLEVVDGVLYVVDNATSTIYGYSLQGELIDWLDTGLPAGCLMGLTMDAQGQLWAVDAPNNNVLRIRAR